MSSFGAKNLAWKSWWKVQNLYLVFWWEIGDHKLTRSQFALASSVPATLFWPLLIPYTVTNPVSAGAIGIALTTCLGNLLYPALILRKPRGTLVEKPGNGLRLHVPARS